VRLQAKKNHLAVDFFHVERFTASRERQVPKRQTLQQLEPTHRRQAQQVRPEQRRQGLQRVRVLRQELLLSCRKRQEQQLR
jgi:hypothetical protein